MRENERKIKYIEKHIDKQILDGHIHTCGERVCVGVHLIDEHGLECLFVVRQNYLRHYEPCCHAHDQWRYTLTHRAKIYSLRVETKEKSAHIRDSFRDVPDGVARNLVFARPRDLMLKFEVHILVTTSCHSASRSFLR